MPFVEPLDKIRCIKVGNSLELAFVANAPDSTFDRTDIFVTRFHLEKRGVILDLRGDGFVKFFARNDFLLRDDARLDLVDFL